uniref:Uncharacterized protein n=1 Tax=Anguilla anguilla TaxID=7936 RepID=A0A0E9PNF4_ANGAN
MSDVTLLFSFFTDIVLIIIFL